MYLFNQLQYYATTITSQAGCDADKKAHFFLGLPKWYAYLPYTYNSDTQHCEITITNKPGTFSNQYWLIGVAAIEILLRIVGIIAVGFIIYGGIKFVTSQGEPENTRKAQSTVINALIGLAIAILASAIVAFIASRLT